MGLIVPHSGHFSKIYKKLMGTPCSLHWREAGEKERVWVVNPGHPIAAGLDPYFVVPETEMYGEPFRIPDPLQVVFISWYDGGEVFRSGVTFQRGAGRIFYFSPGHEVYPIYHDRNVRRVLQNAVKWAYNPAPAWIDPPDTNTPIEKAPEPISEKGPKLHAHGQPGFR
jgi:trehalose utilization protein